MTRYWEILNCHNRQCSLVSSLNLFRSPVHRSSCQDPCEIRHDEKVIPLWSIVARPAKLCEFFWLQETINVKFLSNPIVVALCYYLSWIHINLDRCILNKKPSLPGTIKWNLSTPTPAFGEVLLLFLYHADFTSIFKNKSHLFEHFGGMRMIDKIRQHQQQRPFCQNAFEDQCFTNLNNSNYGWLRYAIQVHNADYDSIVEIFITTEQWRLNGPKTYRHSFMFSKIGHKFRWRLWNILSPMWHQSPIKQQWWNMAVKAVNSYELFCHK